MIAYYSNSTKMSESNRAQQHSPFIHGYYLIIKHCSHLCLPADWKNDFDSFVTQRGGTTLHESVILVVFFGWVGLLCFKSVDLAQRSAGRRE